MLRITGFLLMALALGLVTTRACAQDENYDHQGDTEGWGLDIQSLKTTWDSQVVLTRQAKNPGHSSYLVEWKLTPSDRLTGIGLLNLNTRTATPASAQDYVLAASFVPKADVLLAHYYQPNPTAKPNEWKGLAVTSKLVAEPYAETITDSKFKVEADKPLKFTAQQANTTRTVSYTLTPQGKGTYTVVATMGNNGLAQPLQLESYKGVAILAPDGSLAIAVGDSKAQPSLHLLSHPDWYSSWSGHVLFYGKPALEEEAWIIH